MFAEIRGISELFYVYSIGMAFILDMSMFMFDELVVGWKNMGVEVILVRIKVFIGSMFFKVVGVFERVSEFWFIGNIGEGFFLVMY